MPTPKNLLTITELQEFSFVDKGDNPPAGALILKSAPSTTIGGPVAEQNDVQKRIDEAVAAEVAKRAALEERIAKMEEAEAFGKVEGFCKSAGLDVAKLAAPIRAIEKAAPEAAAVVKGELERLAKGLAAAVNLNGKQIAGVGKQAGSASAQMDAKVAEIMKRDGCDKASAYAKMLAEAPEIYKSYTAEQEA